MARDTAVIKVMDESSALAICFANLKGTKDKDLLETARALQYLKGLPNCGSDARVGQQVGVSREIVRQFLTLLKFPEDIQPLFATKRLKLDQGDSLWQLQRHRKEVLEEAAYKATELTAHDTRHLVDYLIKNPGKSVEDAAEAVLTSKTVVEKEYHVVALLDEVGFRLLEREARQRSMSLDSLATLVIRQWLRSGREV